MSESIDLKAYLREKREIVEEALERFLPSEESYPETLYRAIRYSMFAGGKRLRPILALAACEAAGREIGNALAPACALEMIHTYSLIHDDLPAMDNDDLRRGRPTNHKVFGEAIAILAGDALLTRAFHILPEQVGPTIGEKDLLRIVSEIASAAGGKGMVGGQIVDILYEGDREIDLPTLEYIHTHKTGAMIRASVRVGAIAGGANEEQMTSMTRYGDRIGLAFQITDDILDVEGDEKVLGKQTGSDVRKGKKTYPSFYGIDESRNRARELVDSAVTDLAEFDSRAEPLRALAYYIVERIR
jgi:geranylgeranyl diphosphate synthase type II